MSAPTKNLPAGKNGKTTDSLMMKEARLRIGDALLRMIAAFKRGDYYFAIDNLDAAAESDIFIRWKAEEERRASATTRTTTTQTTPGDAADVADAAPEPAAAPAPAAPVGPEPVDASLDDLIAAHALATRRMEDFLLDV